ncbi:RbsD/FucU family protein [Kordiimonas sp. SCSIO 12610]|uniref:RbsD/FucU family protein n=1 Tax=Kordiimonas sp. SCSIO 12610 TaxID=2829597 RepID=UPI00210B59E2|nr:RbsD/FucU domain-containing protein [Kordiimonas sp. SCSIO 12610]UTW54679.1 hypothetical protein KFF44_12820 [Kordiimonas sp. SCSIO 12610]
MLRGIDPILPPELLRILRAMGHGDEIAIVDANFPAETNANRLIRCDGVSATQMLEAIVKLMPLDSFVDHAAFSMQVVDEPDITPEIVYEFGKIIAELADHNTAINPIERFQFYDKTRTAFAIVTTGERRLYGNIILKKGIIRN